MIPDKSISYVRMRTRIPEFVNIEHPCKVLVDSVIHYVGVRMFEK